jgi:hypothetical protein
MEAQNFERKVDVFLSLLGIDSNVNPVDLTAYPLTMDEVKTYLSNSKRVISGLRIAPQNKKKLEIPKDICNNLSKLIIDPNRFLTDISILKGCENTDDCENSFGCGNLESLTISESKALSDFTPIGECGLLSYLDVSKCPNFDTKASYFLRNLQFLKELNVSHTATNLTYFDQLINLTSLDASYCPEITNLTYLQFLPWLKVLFLVKCKYLTDISGVRHCSQLEYLDLTTCRKIIELNGIQECRDLQTLKMKGCSEITDLAPLRSLTNLTHLEVNNFDRSENSPSLSIFPNLTTLSVGYCQSLSFLKDVTNLETLSIDNTETLLDFPADIEFQGFINVTSLYLDSIDFITDLTEKTRGESIYKLRGMPNLQTLSILNCPRLASLDGVSICEELEFVDIDNCPGLLNLLGLGSAYKLHTLRIKSANINDLSELISCVILELEDCEQFRSFQFKRECKQLEKVTVKNCKSMLDFSSLGRCVRLKELNIMSCIAVQKIEEIGRCALLNELNILDCPRLTYINPCRNLEKLIVLGCDSLPNFDVLASCKGLIDLEIDIADRQVPMCKNVQVLRVSQDLENTITYLGGYDNLLTLKISLSNITSLKGLNLCEDLEIEQCSLLESLEGIQTCTTLKSLYLYNCVNLVDISAILNLPLLTTVVIEGCPQLWTSLGTINFLRTNKKWKRSSDGLISTRVIKS